MAKDSTQQASIKNKITVLVTGQLMLALLCTLIVVLILVNKQVGAQTEALFISKASSLNRAIEQRISYLIDNSQLLTTNELMVNALTDSVGRKAYLTQLVSNFTKGKNVLYLDVVDFDGSPIFQMGDSVLGYNESERLRNALALSQGTIFIDRYNNLIVINPIEYYSTTQGALIISFDLKEIVASTINQDTGLYTRLILDERVIFSRGYDPKLQYKSYQQVDVDFPLFTQLGITLEVGMPTHDYQAPVREAIFALVTVGIALIIASLIVSGWVAHKISRPILELVQRVKQAHAGENVRCSPLGSNDELDRLAQAFDERTLMLEHQAQHDELTQLPNRLLFIDRLQHAIKVARRNNLSFAVLFIDLDRFKEINDSYGHSVGDRLIQVVAVKIAQAIRECDTVARMGGDEFTVLIDSIEHEQDVSIIIQKFIGLFESPLVFDDFQFYLTCSIGAAIYPSDGEDADTLLKNADAAMYKAKAEGRNTYQFYKQELTDTVVERIQIEHDLRLAIERDEFRVFFQPQFELLNRTVIGIEALIRWQHPTKGLVPPNKFIPLAEETGMIIEIDRMMMLSAMSEFKEWVNAGLNPGVLSMNLSMIQLAKDDFLEFFQRSLKACELKPQHIMFEVTETQAMLNPKRTVVMLNQLRALGVGIAIDDFGTGFSSLSYLKQFPVTKIKIDQSFVSDISENQDDEKITRAIISLSESLNLAVIAEGIETEAQIDFLKSYGCYEGQGYLFSKPIPGSELVQLLHSVTQKRPA